MCPMKEGGVPLGLTLIPLDLEQCPHGAEAQYLLIK